jgi:hypothetical protein
MLYSDRLRLGGSVNEPKDLQNVGDAGVAAMPAHHVDRGTDEGRNPGSIPIHKHSNWLCFRCCVFEQVRAGTDRRSAADYTQNRTQ